MDQNPAPACQENTGRAGLLSLFLTFLKIGCIAFGGFMALISVVQNYTVERKKLLTHEDMLDGVSLATILPGPVAVNVVAFVGYRLYGFSGAVVCASAVIFPAFLLLVALSFAYFRFGQVPAVENFFLGFVPAVSAVILSAAWNMRGKAVKGVPEAAIAVAAAGLLIGVGGFLVSLGIIAASGLAGWILFSGLKAGDVRQENHPRAEERPDHDRAGPAGLNSAVVGPALGFSLLGLPTAAKLFTIFAGMSLLLFGGGYVFIPLMQRIVVDSFGWVTRQEFIDGIALGQVTPGPILISAAFIGYKAGGLAGASAATIGIFAPPALLMLVCTRFLDRIRQSGSINAALRGIRPAVVGMIFAAGLVVVRTAPQNIVSLLIFGAALVALFRFKIETAWIIPAAGIAGLLLY
jgi:chromate transporter